jgi:hypothetical protein
MTLRAGHAAAWLLLGLGACSGAKQPEASRNSSGDIVVTSDTAGNRTGPEVVSVGPDGSTLDAAATPMQERVAVLGILNKRNGEAREFKLKPGQAARVDDVIVRLRACERTAPWETDQLTGAFVQLDAQQPDKSYRRVFSGWLYKERPALNVVQNPVYDVWPKSCEMTFRDSGPDTVPAGSPSESNRSSAKKSPSTDGTPSDSPAEVSPSAAPSNAT